LVIQRHLRAHMGRLMSDCITDFRSTGAADRQAAHACVLAHGAVPGFVAPQKLPSAMVSIKLTDLRGPSRAATSHPALAALAGSFRVDAACCGGSAAH